MSDERLKQKKQKGRRHLTVEDYVHGVKNGDRAILARALTLIESNAPRHLEQGQQLLRALIPDSGNTIRIGITGVPGAGKSTLIEALGLHLCEQGLKVAVLAVDPSSSISKGSILGDKTRMEQLSKHPLAFIRPSPSGGTLGGVARKSRESLLICEAAGYDVIIVETVGVGQSETTVRSMVDFFLVLMLTGAGDELQGMKRGIMEMADAIFVNKADGNNKQQAKNTAVEYNRLLHFLKPATEGWETKAYTVSALTGEGIANMWDVIHTFKKETTASGVLKKRRHLQTIEWMETMIKEQLESEFFQHQYVKNEYPNIKQKVLSGAIPPTKAVQILMEGYRRS